MAIAVDAISQGDITASSVTVSHTCTGSNGLLLVGIMTSATSDTVTGVTYNSDAMTRVDTQQGTFGRVFLYGLVGPDTGTHNIVVTCSGSTDIYTRNASYTGVSQSGFPDASSKTAADPGGTLDMTVTTVADNSWMAAFYRQHVTNRAYVNCTPRSPGTDDITQLCDTNGLITPAASHTMTSTTSSAQWQAAVTCSFAPAVAAPASTGNMFLMF